MTVSRTYGRVVKINEDPLNVAGKVLVAAPGAGRRILTLRADISFQPFVPGTAQGVSFGLFMGTDGNYVSRYIFNPSLSNTNPFVQRTWVGDVLGGSDVGENLDLRWYGVHNSLAPGSGYLIIAVDYVIERTSAASDGGLAGT